MAIGNSNGATLLRRPDGARRQFLNWLALLAGGAVLGPLLVRGAGLSAFATQGSNAAIPPVSLKRHVLVFAEADSAALVDRLTAEGFSVSVPGRPQDAHAIAAHIADGRVAVVAAGSGAGAALQFARGNAAVSTVVMFGGDAGATAEEFTALQAKRSYSVLMLDAAARADWTGARHWLDQHLA